MRDEDASGSAEMSAFATRTFRLTCVGVALGLVLGSTAARAGGSDYDQPPIRYSTGPADNPVSRLQARLDAGAVKLDFDARRGYLDGVLKQLGLPASSQTLVFSKTSLQRERISPDNPRALYFNDDTYVGWVRGGEVVELATADPKLGVVFYTLDQRRSEAPKFVRQTDNCLQCHSGSMTRDVPGLMLRSVRCDPTGQPILAAGTTRVTPETPFADRWGGWYVTGTSGSQFHHGNVTAKDRDDTGPLDLSRGSNVTGLAGRFDAGGYITPHSDLAALMVLEHQAEGHNLIARANYLTRLALRDEAAMNEATGQASDERSESTERRIRSAGEPLVKHLLFSGEAPLTGRVAGTSTFEKDFAARGPQDRRGRSLREFDLERRLFRHPCSYLIYSADFDGLPDPVKQYVYRRLWQVLTGRDADPEFARLSEADQTAVYDILLDTKPGLPDYWKPRD
jgi:hypothetical protein